MAGGPSCPSCGQLGRSGVAGRCNRKGVPGRYPGRVPGRVHPRYLDLASTPSRLGPVRYVSASPSARPQHILYYIRPEALPPTRCSQITSKLLVIGLSRDGVETRSYYWSGTGTRNWSRSRTWPGLDLDLTSSSAWLWPRPRSRSGLGLGLASSSALPRTRPVLILS